jgi:hypothetical protein
MGELWSDEDEVTEVEVVDLIGRFLPPGDGRAVKVDNAFVVSWAAREKPDRVYEGRSARSFDEAYHVLIARCARQFLRHAAR